MQVDTYKINGTKHATEALIEQIENRDEVRPFQFPVTFPGAKVNADGVLHSTIIVTHGFSEDHARKRLLKMTMEGCSVGPAIKRKAVV